MAKADVMAGRAYVSIYTKNDKLTSGLRAAQQQLQQFGASMLSLGAKMATMTVALATPIAFATKTFSDFDDAMRAVKAVSQATEAQFASMTERAKELGRTTSFTAIQVAQLMTELGRAGFAPEQVNVMTEAVMNLARASGTEAAIASGIMAATIRQFGLEAADAARVSDVLTVAANSTFNSVESLGEALSYAGPVAAELGMSLEDTVAILGTLGNVGIQGSEAGTALRRLSVISAATGEDLKGIFGISNIDAAGNLKPIVQIMDEIGKKIEKLPMAEKVAKMNEAFGLLGITSSSVLSHAAVETTALAEKLKNAEGAAAAAAKEMDKGLGGAFRIIMSAVEGLQIAIGGALQESIQGITVSLTNVIGKASEWVDKNKDMTVAVAAAVAALGAASAAILGVGIAAKIAAVGIGIAITGIAIVKTATKLAIGAFNLFVAASTGVASVLQGIFATSLLATAAATATLATTQAAASVVVTTYAGLLTAAASSTALLGISSGLTTSALIAQSTAMIGASAASGGMILSSGGASAGMLSLSGSSIVAAAGLGTFTAAGGVMATAWTGISGVMAAAWGVIMGPITPFIIAGAAIVAVMTAIGAAAAYSAIKGTDFSQAWNVAKNTLVELLATAKQVGGILMDALAGGDYDIAFRAVMAGIKVALADSLDAMSSLWSMFWRGAFDMAKRFATNLLTMMYDVVKTIAKAMADPLTAANNIGKQLARIANGELKLSLGIDTAKMRADAKAELAALEAEMAARKAKRAAGPDAAKDPEVDAIQKQIDAVKQAQAAWADMDQAQIDMADPFFDREFKFGGGTDAKAVGIASKASVASFSLAELAGNSNRGTAEKQLTVAQQQKKIAEEALIVGQQTMLALMGLWQVHP